MSGVTTSSLSLAWSLRNWLILDYEEANGQTVRPWAPFLLLFSTGYDVFSIWSSLPQNRYVPLLLFYSLSNLHYYSLWFPVNQSWLWIHRSLVHIENRQESIRQTSFVREKEREGKTRDGKGNTIELTKWRKYRPSFHSSFNLAFSRSLIITFPLFLFSLVLCSFSLAFPCPRLFMRANIVWG